MNYLAVIQFLTCVLHVSAGVISPTSEEVNMTAVLEQMNSLQDTVAELTTNLTSANQELENSKTLVNSLQNNVDSLHERLSFTKVYDARVMAEIGKPDPIISFQAHLAEQTPNFSDMEIFKFSDVRDNRGDGYNSTTGYFTAPVSGSYLFWCNIVNHHPMNYLSVYLFREDKRLAYAVAPPYVYDGSAIMSVVTFLKTGQTICFRKYKGSNVPLGAGWSSFGGTLIRSI